MKNIEKFIFDIDVTGACNLQCPSCPQGNSKNHRQPPGLMTPGLLEKIVTKASTECVLKGINLFNWGEPLLHPEIHGLIHIVQNASISCHLSSNLNILPDADALMAANPASFKISASGFTQEIYGLTHRGGNIVRVKNNMVALAKAKKRNNAATRIFVSYHRYRHNLVEEPMMRKFAIDLGFGFEPVWAQMLPLEKILDYVHEGTPDFLLTEEDNQLIERLALPLKEALAIAQKSKSLPCRLRESQISLDFRGNVMLCCGIFDAEKYIIGNFMDLPFEEIQTLRQNHSMCKRCMLHNAHMYLTSLTPEIDALILATISPEDIEHLDLRHEMAQEHLELRLQKIYQKYFSVFFTNTQKMLLKTQVYRMLSFINKAKR